MGLGEHCVQLRGPALHERFGPAQPTREYAPAPSALDSCKPLVGGVSAPQPSLALPRRPSAHLSGGLRLERVNYFRRVIGDDDLASGRHNRHATGESDR